MIQARERNNQNISMSTNYYKTTDLKKYYCLVRVANHHVY